jgi:DNA-binding CsgD family transcriptional regulator
MTNSPISSDLSSREQEVLSLILSGNSYAQIAQSLGISIETVRKHAHNAYTKMQVRGRSAAKKVIETESNATS